MYDNSAERILAEALKLGFVKMKITKLLISGAAATGKSSLIAMLLGKPPVLKHDSTLLSRPVRHARFTAEGDSNQKWECLDDPVDLEELLAGGIKDLAARNRLEQRSHAQPEPKKDMDYTSAELSYTSQSNVEAAYNKSETFASLVPLVKSAVDSKSLETVHWIYTIDSGGQPAFLDILPAFIRGNSITIHTLKLDCCLKDRIKMVFSINGEICDSEDLCTTSLQMIETLVRSSSSSYFLADGTKKAKAHCIIVGTFYDKIGMSTERLKVIDSQLQGNLHSDGVLIPPEDGMIIFPVDTTVDGEEREKKACELREMITYEYVKKTDTDQERKIPVKWFTFELELRKQKNEQGILSMDECIQIGKMFEMDEKKVMTCIKYLHEQTLLLYFEKPLPNTVFIHAQTILDKVSAIIVVSFLYNKKNKSRDLLRAIMELPNGTKGIENLRLLGRFDRKLLDCLPDILACALSKKQSVLFSDIFTADNFLDLLEHLLLIAKLPEEGQYFIPCVLPTKPQEEPEQQKEDLSENADALCIRWSEMPIPLGLFPALVVHLLQRDNGQEFTLLKGQQQYRNAIFIDCPPIGGAIVLVDSIDWIEVHYSGKKSKCPQIRRAIVNGISTVVNTFGYQDELRKPRQGFLYRHCCSKSTPAHVCFVPTEKDKTSVTCPNNKQVFDCSDQQRCWFDSDVQTPSGQSNKVLSCIHNNKIRLHYYCDHVTKCRLP